MKYPPFILQPLPHPSRRNCWEAIKTALYYDAIEKAKLAS